MPAIDLTVCLLALMAAFGIKPWRIVGTAGPPWPWLAWTAVLPLLWAGDPRAALAAVQAPAGACLLALMAGWPLAIIFLIPVTAASAWLGDWSWVQALHQAAWLGVIPSGFALALGAALRRWAPHHVFVYILGRAFLGTLVSVALASGLALALGDGTANLEKSTLMIGRLLSAFGDAFLTGMLTAIFVAFKPHWLATWADRIYLGS